MKSLQESRSNFNTCPFLENPVGRRIRDHDLDNWVEGIELDKAIRASYPHATEPGQHLHRQYFLHRGGVA